MSIFTDLVINGALIISLVALYGSLYRQLAHRARTFQVVTGVLFGGAAIAVMNIPFHFMPGVIFDTRSVIVSAAGMFGGPLAAVLAAYGSRQGDPNFDADADLNGDGVIGSPDYILAAQQL